MQTITGDRRQETETLDAGNVQRIRELVAQKGDISITIGGLTLKSYEDNGLLNLKLTRIPKGVSGDRTDIISTWDERKNGCQFHLTLTDEGKGFITRQYLLLDVFISSEVTIEDGVIDDPTRVANVLLQDFIRTAESLPDKER